ncbi:uncharacterized protein LOC129307649 [Prosopis cineraria]|uniref:uncharacterized protein LOC129295713 n=1 Tax=Prosopis cineraria TaxID=364024 RepID=UPI00240E9E6B|nr:uncharacterized protein LOC129295713 [Prosopis cineraria]XP_054804478.1 uncharacterized protein LOC129307649 [Prosopis cineraria]
MAMSGSETENQTRSETTKEPQVEVESVKCDSCGFSEDCTPAYISHVRQRFQGRWLCGLCVEAVKVEVLRSDRLITLDEALDRHIRICSQFRSSPGGLRETEHPIFAMGRVLRRSLDSPRHLRSNSSSFTLPVVHDQARSSPLVRSESCFSSISG